jgi:transposase
MAFRPDAGHNIPYEKTRLLRVSTSRRGQRVEIRKRLLAQIKALAKLGSDDRFDVMEGELKALLDRRIAGLQTRSEQIIASDESLARIAGILRSASGVGPVASTRPIAETPKPGPIAGEQAAALTGPAPSASDRGAMLGKRDWRWL